MSSRSLLKLLFLVTLGWLAGCSPKDSPAPTEARPPFLLTAAVSGKSMLPTFGDEQVQAEICSFYELKTGDTVIRWVPDFKSYTHHRLDSFDPEHRTWWTKGDNNSYRDPSPMRPSDFVCRTHKQYKVDVVINLPLHP